MTGTEYDTYDSADPGEHPECPFCDVERIKSEVTTRRSVVGGIMCLIFEPLNPVTPGHVLIVPEDHVANAAAGPRHAAAAMYVAAEYADRHESANIITSIGAAATQTVAHMHVHVVPRTPGDGLALPWSAPAVAKSTLERVRSL